MPAVQVPVRVIFGKNVMRERLGEEASAFGARSVLIVTDNTIVRQGFLEIAEDALKSAGIEMRVFDRVSPEPTLELAEDVAAFAREERCDVVVGLGGGSVLDMAKVAAAATTNPDQRASDFLGANKIANPSAKKILVPTTAGTGAEATPFALIVAAGKKKAIASPFNIADIAILDPTLTATMPPRVTASTGMDALSHAIEALMSKGANALTDAFAYEAIQKIAANIEEVFAHGENIDARLEMSIAAFLAGAAFGNA
ncbi:alcohol dehydrogenase, partial [Methanosarcinales archaeon]